MSDAAAKLLNVIMTRQAVGKGPECTTYIALQEMTKTERDTLTGLFADPSIRHTSLAAGFKSLGFPIHVDSIARHRKGECACAKRRAETKPPR